MSEKHVAMATRPPAKRLSDGIAGTDGVRLQKQGDIDAHTKLYGPRYGQMARELVDKQKVILIVRQHLARTGSRESQILLNKIISDFQNMHLESR